MRPNKGVAREDEKTKSRVLNVVDVSLLKLEITLLVLVPTRTSVFIRGREEVRVGRTSGPNVSVSLILAVSGSSPYAFKLRASSAWIHRQRQLQSKSREVRVRRGRNQNLRCTFE